MPMPSKGDRDYLPIRVPRVLGDKVRARADELGFACTNDYVNAVLAEHEGMPKLAPIPRPPLAGAVLFNEEGGHRRRRSA